MPRVSLKPIALLVVTAIVLMLTLAASGTFAHAKSNMRPTILRPCTRAAFVRGCVQQGARSSRRPFFRSFPRSLTSQYLPLRRSPFP